LYANSSAGLAFLSPILCLYDAPPPDIHTLSLHDALPIYSDLLGGGVSRPCGKRFGAGLRRWPQPRRILRAGRSRFLEGCGRRARSEEHTSELQSRRELVCRLLLEKKKKDGCEAH